MKKIIILAALYMMTVAANAQIISGKIVDCENEPVDFATVVLQTADSLFVQSTYTDSSGVFRFEAALPTFRLIVQHFLYEPFENTYSSNETGSISLTSKENLLNEVVVKGERPLVRVIDGKMTYDIARLVENKVVGNAYESLLQLPGVREQNDNLLLAGANSLTVIINGKPTSMTTEQLMQMLKTMPVSMLEKAEVLYSAPPQYHVRGAAINLILQGHTSENSRLTGQVNSAYTQKYYVGYSAGGNLFYNTDRFSVDFLYAFNQSHTKSGEDQYSHHLFENKVYDIDQFDKGDDRSSDHNFRLATDYKIDEKNKISLAYTAQITPHFKKTATSDGTYSNSVNDKKETSPVEMHNIGLNYTSGFGLDAGVDYTCYKNHNQQNFEEKKPGKERTFLSFSNQDIRRLNAYLDQSHSLANGWILNYGTKFSYASQQSLQTYHSQTEPELSGLNTDSRLDEYTSDVYAGFQKQFTPAFSLMASLTGEYYQFDNFDEWTIFPSLQVTYVFAPTHIVQLSFSSDKAYPSYWEMNGSIGYINGYSEAHGNPQLKPSKDYTAQLNYILKSKYIFTLFTSYDDNYFVQLPYQSPERLAMIYKVTNFDYKQS
ncbi:MAG: TonB-dependent receptor, partial [Candidatus Symbiothrix sp.]|nr:TonB-dependent receptor [Candidatus Symbiothrix sp.]